VPPTKFGFRRALTRKEDDALVRFEPAATSPTIPPTGALHAVFLRSPPCARALSLTDAAKAAAMPGFGWYSPQRHRRLGRPVRAKGRYPNRESAFRPNPIWRARRVRHSADGGVLLWLAQTLDQRATLPRRSRSSGKCRTAWVGVGGGIGAGRAAGVAAGDPRRGNLVFETELGLRRRPLSPSPRRRARVASRSHQLARVSNYLDTRLRSRSSTMARASR